MKSDARAAAKVILATNKVRMESCWAQTKHAFLCAPGAAILFIAVALTEVFTNTLIILFNVGLKKTHVYMVLVIAVVPRVAVFVWASWVLSKKHWWRYWITIDNVLLLTTVITIVYGYMLLRAPGGSTPEQTGAIEWRIAAVVSLPILMSAFNGNFRILVKMYPWTPLTILIYKLLRIYAVLIGTITQLDLRSKGISGMDLGLLLLYITSQVSYHVSLLSRIPSWTAWQRSMEAKAKAAKAAGVTLTLDEHAAARATADTAAIAHLSAGYASYDDENEDALHYFQHGEVTSSGREAESLLLGPNHRPHPSTSASEGLTTGANRIRAPGRLKYQFHVRDPVSSGSPDLSSSVDSISSQSLDLSSDSVHIPIVEQTTRGILIDDSSTSSSDENV